MQKMIDPNEALSCEQLASLESKATAKLIRRICHSGRFYMLHPINGVVTECEASAERSISHVLKFCDEDGGNIWYLVQISSFIDAWIAGNQFHSYGGQAVFTKQLMIKLNDSALKFSTTGSSKRKVTGLLLSGNRPYHYLYDRYIHALELSQDYDLARYVFRTRKAYLTRLPNAGKDEEIGLRKKQGCYISPCLGQKDEVERLTRTSKYLTNIHASSDALSKQHLSLWVGITSQENRRMWKEQVPGLIAYIKYVANRSKLPVEVLVDGWTSFAGGNASQKDLDTDKDVEAQIAREFDDDPYVSFKSLIGADYDTKLTAAMCCDLAVTNDCGGALITYTLCKRPSILHGNRVMRSASQALGYPSARCVEYSKIITLDGPKPSNTDYSMDWQLLIPETEALLEDQFKKISWLQLFKSKLQCSLFRS